MVNRSIFWNIISWIFGVIFFAIGIVNTFWGNDTGFGIFIMLLSLIYFLPANPILRKRIGFSIPVVVKILLGIFILWAALGVGELFDKIDLMLNSFQQPITPFCFRYQKPLGLLFRFAARITSSTSRKSVLIQKNIYRLRYNKSIVLLCRRRYCL